MVRRVVYLQINFTKNIAIDMNCEVGFFLPRFSVQKETLVKTIGTMGVVDVQYRNKHSEV